MGIETKKLSDQKTTAQQLGRDLSIKLSEIKKSGQNVLLLLSGGSVLEPLMHIESACLDKHITISMLDERYDPSNQNSNFIQLTKTEFYRRAKKAGCNFIDTSVKRSQTQKELGSYFEKQLRNWKKTNKRGIILATLGMGQDGHIAGIMPYSENKKLFDKLFCGKNHIVCYDASGKNPYSLRITATATFLKSIDQAFAFICGQEKSANFKKITSPGKISELPCRTLKQIKNLTIYTDIK